MRRTGRRLRDGVALWAGLLLLTSCAGRTATVAERHDRVIDRFEARVDEYMDLREEAVDATAPLQPTSDPATITATRQALGAEIRRRRSSATQGSIFSPDIRSHFRELLAPVVAGERGEDVRFRLNDDAPDAGAVPLEVNAAYPAGLPFPTTPWPILSALPELPRGLSYRIIGRDLILLDEPADVIVDYMRNALPTKPAAP